MKVLTTIAALDRLGPAYAWRTRAYGTGPVRAQVLEGDLVLVGGGDPFLTADRFWSFVSGLRQAGVQRVAGDVVIDNTYFAPQGDDRAAFDNRPFNTYNVLPDALLVNFQTVTVSAVPDVATDSVRASANPWPANLSIDNAVRLDPGPCRRGADGIQLTMPDGALGNRIALSGRYAAGCGQFMVSRAVMKAPDYAYGLFRTLWQQAGGTIEGGLRLGVVPADARLLYTHDSLTLAEIIRLINKFSSNVMARNLFLTVAAEKSGRPATAAGGRPGFHRGNGDHESKQQENVHRRHRQPGRWRNGLAHRRGRTGPRGSGGDRAQARGEPAAGAARHHGDDRGRVAAALDPQPV